MLTMMFVAVCCSSFFTLAFTPTITTLKQTVQFKSSFCLIPGENSCRDTEDQHEDDVDNIRMDEDRGEEALARHEIADEEEGEGERPEQSEQEGQRRGRHGKVRHHLIRIEAQAPTKLFEKTYQTSQKVTDCEAEEAGDRHKVNLFP